MGCKWDTPPESMADALGKCYCPRCISEREQAEKIEKLKAENERLKKKLNDNKGPVV